MKREEEGRICVFCLLKYSESGDDRSYLWLECNLKNVLRNFVLVKVIKLIYYVSISQKSFAVDSYL